MSDEVAHDSVNASADSGPTGDRSRRPRKRGKRNRSRAGESPSAAPTVATPTVEPERSAPAPHRERAPRRSGGNRHGQHGFADGLDRSVCVVGVRRFPGEWPVNYRRGLAISPLREVARRSDEVLLCDQLHEGDCLWADGETVLDAGGPIVRTISAEPVAAPTPAVEPPPVVDDAGTDADS